MGLARQLYIETHENSIMDIKLVLSVIILFQAYVTIEGLKCYVCDGHAVFDNEGHCGDPFEPTDQAPLTECSETEKFCQKTKTGVNNIWTKVIRSCQETCAEKNTLHVDDTTCCQTDKCNGAMGVVSTGAATITMLLVAKYIL